MYVVWKSGWAKKNAKGTYIKLTALFKTAMFITVLFKTVL